MSIIFMDNENLTLFLNKNCPNQERYCLPQKEDNTLKKGRIPYEDNLFHSILYLLSPEYHQLHFDKEKKKLVSNFKHYILEEINYSKISHKTKLDIRDNIKRNIDWSDKIFFVFSYIFGINIIVSNNLQTKVYTFDLDNETNYPYIVLHKNGKLYQPCYTARNEKRKFMFIYQKDDFIAHTISGAKKLNQTLEYRP